MCMDFMRPTLEILDTYKKMVGKILMSNQSESIMKKENLNIFQKESSFTSFNS